jgi:hypothetical protein
MPNGNPAPGPLNSRYFPPVRGKETRARRWDLQFESAFLQRRVSCELAPHGFGVERAIGMTCFATVHHQIEVRIEAHVFIAFLAYCLHVTLAR